MSSAPIRSYVAIGDSLSEGLGDFAFDQDRHNSGWTDRLAGMLANEAARNGHDFHFANLAIRGSKIDSIMGEQLDGALRLKPDLVTVMAGSNNFVAKDLSHLEQTLHDGILQLLANGSRVVVATTIRPAHLKFFKRVLPRAQRMSQMIRRVAAEFSLPVIDVYNITDFEQLDFWCEDMVHFSGHGHIRVANVAAQVLGLEERIVEALPHERETPSRDLISTLRWYRVYVWPFVVRRIKGVSSGAGILPKHTHLVRLTPERELVLAA